MLVGDQLLMAYLDSTGGGNSVTSAVPFSLATNLQGGGAGEG